MTDTATLTLAALLLIPILSGVVLAMIKSAGLTRILNVGASALTFLVSCLLFLQPHGASDLFLIDDLNITFIVLTTFVSLTTSIFSGVYIGHELETGRIGPRMLRLYHAMFQWFVSTLLLALVANNLGILWVAVEGATLTTVLMVGLYRTHESIEAAWKYFILCGVGIGLALFGTILVYLAAQPVLGHGMEAMSWTALVKNAGAMNAAILNLAFVFLLVGYGTKSGLVPFHAWLPDAHAEGPTPISAVLSGLLLNVALYAILRFKMLLAVNENAIAAGPLMIGLGALSIMFAGYLLYKRSDIKRFFAYSSIEHMGICAFAFGIGGPIANFAGLLHMTMHSLTKSGIFFAVGHIAQVRGSQKFRDLGGLVHSHPALGWSFVLAVAAISGLPPFGVFVSEFMILTSAFAHSPWLTVPYLLGLLTAFGALLLCLQRVAFGEPQGPGVPLDASLWPLWAHLALVLVAGLYLPPALVSWFSHVAAILG
jgi:hydrogenase-4 component F